MRSSSPIQSLAWLVGVVVLCGASVHGREDKDPMMAAESSSYLDLLRARSSLSPAKVPTPTSAGSASSYFTKPAITYSEPDEVYKKAASEYWNSEMASPGEALEEDYGYGQQAAGGYLSPQGGYQKGKEISVTPDHKPITLHYRTHSQPIMVHQTRIPGPKPEVKYTKSHEDPHRVVHEVIRPIIQEVHEIIQPYRRVVQQVQPVIEEVRTVVAKDAGKGPRMGDGGGGYGKGSPSYGESKQVYRKALVYEAQPSPSESQLGSMALPPGLMAMGRSKVFINKRGVPVYQSHYMGPAFARS